MLCLPGNARVTGTFFCFVHNVKLARALASKLISSAQISSFSEVDVTLDDIAHALATMGDVKGRVNLIEVSDMLTHITQR